MYEAERSAASEVPDIFDRYEYYFRLNYLWTIKYLMKKFECI